MPKGTKHGYVPTAWDNVFVHDAWGKTRWQE
jgi:hypothetical protein